MKKNLLCGLKESRKRIQNSFRIIDGYSKPGYGNTNGVTGSWSEQPEGIVSEVIGKRNVVVQIKSLKEEAVVSQRCLQPTLSAFKDLDGCQTSNTEDDGAIAGC
ncbi:hypothetical protein AVEN_151243-1 [Araneus ventricosus]|uniref:Uncharacterized protein n=1 Tax=Araneus ventricosus TaxID=182803 RepID=A0A4Y2TUF3_ARAVE|nr:hypothetical protein AVEN_151243-1 [Araneus ventricosus]